MNDVTHNFDPNDIMENKGVSILCYFSLLMLVPLLTKPNSQFVKFHANQGLVLLIASFAAGLIVNVPFVGSIIGPGIGIAVTVFSIMGIIHSAQGKAVELPIISNIKIL